MDNDKFISPLATKVATSTLTTMSDPDPDGRNTKQAQITLFLSLLALILLCGTEPFKVILRRNIGRFALGIWSTILAGLVHLILGVALIDPLYSGHNGLFINVLLKTAIVFHEFWGLAILVLGILAYWNGSNTFYRGESIYFKSDLEKGVAPEHIWSVKEPGYALLFSLVMTLLNFFIGIPLLISAICFWINEIYHVSLIQKANAIHQAKTQAAMEAKLQQQQAQTSHWQKVINEIE